MPMIPEFLTERFINLAFAVIQAILIALITKNALDRALQKEKAIGKRLKSYGIENVKSGDGKMSRHHINLAFGLRGHTPPKGLDICFITGRAFFQDFQVNTDYIGRVVAQGCHVRVLLANPYDGYIYKNTLWKDAIDDCSIAQWRMAQERGETPDPRYLAYIDAVAQYYLEMLADHSSDAFRNASFIERSDAMLLSSKIKAPSSHRAEYLKEIKNLLLKLGDHRTQVLCARQILESIVKAHPKCSGKVELRCYADEYRMPITLVRKDATKKSEELTLLWTNINAAIRETTESINIFCKVKGDRDKTYISDMEKTFEYLWSCYDNVF